MNFSILKIKIEKSGIGGDDYRHYKTKEIEKARGITISLPKHKVFVRDIFGKKTQRHKDTKARKD